ncbi:NACHT, LRR and PYD domains-containing protein 4-like [Talpa occidentalis]|uniref:NACHT, LRR and PYD domains-containing protein 4-like n=1 Tax=Talpa occidentalis TaxID=50954 RepID=UPI00188F0C6B|nr:NACHT, LRR and PYD domains-containing protein 4-like [Talpa occidentalis]
MAASFFADFGLMWYLEELRREEFRKFKELLRSEPPPPGRRQVPWAEVKRAAREGLAELLRREYGEQGAWAVTLRVFQRMNRQDLCAKARSEGTGHAKAYQAYIKEKFGVFWARQSATMIQDFLSQDANQRDCECMEHFFSPQEPEAGGQTVVLRGMPGIGKTTLLVRLMVVWAEGRIYRDRFSYVFYLSCWEMKQWPATSLAELMSKGWSDSLAAVEEILSQPERLLFIIDGFEELDCDLKEPEAALCRDCLERRPAATLVSSLLQKRVLPGASLLVATTSERLQDIEHQLHTPTIRLLLGFTTSEVKLYFCSTIPDTRRVAEAFRLVRASAHLACLCGIPVLCWLACACLKQEVEAGRDLAEACASTTSLYSTFFLHLFPPKGGARLNPQSQGRLGSLCSLAAEGMWTDTFVFSAEDLRRNGLADTDLPALLDARVLRPWGTGDQWYRFPHTSAQEFCAALFYFLAQRRAPAPVGSAEDLFFLCLRKMRVRWIFLGPFVFGLLSEREQRRLEARVGPHPAGDVRRALQQHLQHTAESELLQQDLDFLALFYCLFEMQSADFAGWTMGLFPEVAVSITDSVELAVSAYCLKLASGLTRLAVSIQNVFDEETKGCEACPRSGNVLSCWNQVCSALATETLQEFQLCSSVLDRAAFTVLCHLLRRPSCHLQRLEINNVALPAQRGALFQALTRCPDLRHLNLGSTALSRSDVCELSKALGHPASNVQELLLTNCLLSGDDCEVLASMLTSNKKLKLLNLSFNYLDQGLPLLCEALRHPECELESLVLVCCYLTEHSWASLHGALLCNTSLAHLDLSANVLRREDLQLLCEALRQPSCRLPSLCLSRCFLTTDGCQDLAAVLASTQSLTCLQIGRNDIGDVGAAALCEALAHPSCRLEKLGLSHCRLTSACCGDLAAALVSTKTLQKLDLRGNALGRGGVAELCQALGDPERSLRVLGLLKGEFDQETQRLLQAVEEQNPRLKIAED